MNELGAYGLRLAGVEDGRRWLLPQRADAPRLTLEKVHGPLPDRTPVIDRQRADLGLIEGVWLSASATDERVVFTAEWELTDAELIHPFLAPVAALHWLWRGRETLHAGAVLLGGGAVLLLGDKEAGKSTTLAFLADAGHPVLSDDLIVVSPEMTMPAGPLSIDLRPSMATTGEPVRGGQRNRLSLAQTPITGEIPIRGWVRLSWDERTELTPLSGAERLTALASARRVRRLEGDPEAVLNLSALPAYHLSRPRTLGALAPTSALLESAFP